MIACDDGDNIVEEILIIAERFFEKIFGLLKSHLLVMRANKRERMTKMSASAMIDHNYGPLQNIPLLSFLLFTFNTQYLIVFYSHDDYKYNKNQYKYQHHV